MNVEKRDFLYKLLKFVKDGVVYTYSSSISDEKFPKYAP